MKRAAVLVLACGALAGCASPEASRQRGGGPGADPGNRPAQVMMHEGSRQYWKTPDYIRGEGPPLAASEQARRLTLAAPSSSPQASSPAGGRRP